MSELSLIANWNYPTSIRVGVGRVKEIAEVCLSLGMNAPLLVTDPGLARLSMIHEVIEQCQTAGLRVRLYHEIKTNPTYEHVSFGVTSYREGEHDGVIAFGGGSALDVGKAIGFMVGQDRPLWDFEDIGDNWKRVNVAGMAQVLAVPTAAGTGSEVGRSSVITDHAAQKKKIIFHPNMLPRAVILDPELTISLPPKMTAATGMDALSHNLESYCVPNYHPMAEGIALEGMRLIKRYLPRAVHYGSDLDARTHMLVASSMGATAFQRGLGAMHALAHPLGAIYDAHHGHLNAILMPYVLCANRPVIEKKIARLAGYLDINHGFDGFLDWLLHLREEIGIEHTLADIGIDEQHLKVIATSATQDASAVTNPIIFTKQQYQTILSHAIRGHMRCI